jgi:hypothetical protein
MNMKTNIQILKQLQSYLLEHGGKYILYQNRDSMHILKESIAWMNKNGMNQIEGPSTSPDMSIMETWVKPLKQKFYSRTCYAKAESVQLSRYQPGLSLNSWTLVAVQSPLNPACTSAPVASALPYK